MPLRHAKAAFRDAQKSFDHDREPHLYDLALGLRLLTEGLEEELSSIRRQLAEIARDAIAARDAADKRATSEKG